MLSAFLFGTHGRLKLYVVINGQLKERIGRTGGEAVADENYS